MRRSAIPRCMSVLAMIAAVGLVQSSTAQATSASAVRQGTGAVTASAHRYASPLGAGAPRTRGPHAMGMDLVGRRSLINTSGPHLQYYGGPVLSHMKSVDVYWGASVSSTVKAAIPGFTTAYLGAGPLSWLNEYNTNLPGGTNQSIGQGTQGGSITITPSTNATSLLDSDVQAELTSQIHAGHLPVPDANTSYAIFFPPGVSICMSGSCSLVQFCAYHGTMMYGSVMFTYQVMPDLSSTSGCGTNATVLQNTTEVLSHELAETITDPGVGLAASYAAPLGWYDPQGSNGEIGDICNGQAGTFTSSGTTWTSQLLWSNYATHCIESRTYTVPGAATYGTLVPSKGSVLVNWNPPASDGGSPIVHYTVTAQPGGKACVVSVTHCTISALTPTQPYSFSLTAANAVGTGAPATSASVYPATSPTLSLLGVPHVAGAKTAFSFGVIGGTPGATVAVSLTHASPPSCILNGVGQCTVTTTEPRTGVWTLTITSKSLSAHATLYVPKVTTPASAKVGSTISVKVSSSPPKAVVQLKASDGRAVTVKASAAGAATLPIKAKAKGALTITIRVSGVVVGVQHVAVS